LNTSALPAALSLRTNASWPPASVLSAADCRGKLAADDLVQPVTTALPAESIAIALPCSSPEPPMRVE